MPIIIDMTHQADLEKLPPRASGIVQVSEVKLHEWNTSHPEQLRNLAPVYHWSFEIMTGAYQGMPLWMYTSLDNKELWKLRRLLEALYNTNITGKFNFDRKDATQRSFQADMRIWTDHSGHKRIKVTRYYPLTDQQRGYARDNFCQTWHREASLLQVEAVDCN